MSKWKHFAVPDGLHGSNVYAPAVSPLVFGGQPSAELQNPCTTPRQELFVSIRVAPPIDNYICFEVEVDRRTLQRATVATPEEFLEQGVWLEPPTIARRGATAHEPIVVDWLRRNRVAYLQPGTVDEANAPVRIDSPVAGAIIERGNLLVTGRAQSRDLVGWTLSARRLGGEEVIIVAEGGRGVDGGVLARWDSSEISGGVYHLRLEVVDGYLGSISHQIVIAVPEDASVAETESEAEEAE